MLETGKLEAGEFEKNREYQSAKERKNDEFFLFFSMVGWIYEMTLSLLAGNVRSICNRGFLVGPYLPNL